MDVPTSRSGNSADAARRCPCAADRHSLRIRGPWPRQDGHEHGTQRRVHAASRRRRGLCGGHAQPGPTDRNRRDPTRSVLLPRLLRTRHRPRAARPPRDSRLAHRASGRRRPARRGRHGHARAICSPLSTNSMARRSRTNMPRAGRTATARRVRCGAPPADGASTASQRPSGRRGSGPAGYSSRTPRRRA